MARGEQLIGGHALESLRDVVGDGQGGAVELVAEAWGEGHAGFFEEVEHGIIEAGCRLPGGEFLELLVFCHAIPVGSVVWRHGGWPIAEGRKPTASARYPPPAFHGEGETASPAPAVGG